jgi:hypothetical protein
MRETDVTTGRERHPQDCLSAIATGLGPTAEFLKSPEKAASSKLQNRCLAATVVKRIANHKNKITRAGAASGAASVILKS